MNTIEQRIKAIDASGTWRPCRLDQLNTIEQRIKAIETAGLRVICARNTGAYYVAHVGNGQWSQFYSLEGLSEFAKRQNAGIVFYDDCGNFVS